MKIKINVNKKKELKEFSGAGAIVGAPAIMTDETDDEHAKDIPVIEEGWHQDWKVIREMYSSSGHTIGMTKINDDDEVHSGSVERNNHRDNPNMALMEEESPEIEIAKKILAEKGYVAWKVLASGQFGSVMQAETDIQGNDGDDTETQDLEDLDSVDGDGDEYGANNVAIKVLWEKTSDGGKGSRNVDISDLEREVRNYRLINKARNIDEDIKKHFPEVFETFIEVDEEGNQMAFIVMEMLQPLNKDAQQHFAGPAHNAARNDRGLGVPASRIKNMSGDFQSSLDKRAETFFLENEKHMKELQTNLMSLVPDDKKNLPIVQGSLANLSIGPLQRYSHISQTSAADSVISSKINDIKTHLMPKNDDEDEFAPRTTSYSLRQLDRMVKEYEENKFVVLCILHVVEQFMRVAQELSLGSIDFMLENVLKSLQKAIRLHTNIHTHYKRKNIKNPTLDGGRLGVEKALLKIRKLTGLFPQDLHWKNLMQRSDNTIVVVDLGLFKNTTDFRKDKEKKQIQESKQFSFKVVRNLKK